MYDPNYDKIWQTFAWISLTIIKAFRSQTLERVFHQVSKHFEVCMLKKCGEVLLTLPHLMYYWRREGTWLAWNLLFYTRQWTIIRTNIIIVLHFKTVLLSWEMRNWKSPDFLKHVILYHEKSIISQGVEPGITWNKSSWWSEQDLH